MMDQFKIIDDVEISNKARHLLACPLMECFKHIVAESLTSKKMLIIGTDVDYEEDVKEQAQLIQNEFCTGCVLKNIHLPISEAFPVEGKPGLFNPAIEVFYELFPDD